MKKYPEAGKFILRYVGAREFIHNEMLFNLFVRDPDFEWLMIDASYIKVHPHATGAKGGNQAMGRTKGGSIRKFT